jgi:hypothetical protein
VAAATGGLAWAWAHHHAAPATPSVPEQQQQQQQGWRSGHERPAVRAGAARHGCRLRIPRREASCRTNAQPALRAARRLGAGGGRWAPSRPRWQQRPAGHRVWAGVRPGAGQLPSTRRRCLGACRACAPPGGGGGPYQWHKRQRHLFQLQLGLHGQGVAGGAGRSGALGRRAGPRCAAAVCVGRGGGGVGAGSCAGACRAVLVARPPCYVTRRGRKGSAALSGTSHRATLTLTLTRNGTNRARGREAAGAVVGSPCRRVRRIRALGTC